MVAPSAGGGRTASCHEGPSSGNHLSRLCSRTFSSMMKLTSSSGPEYVIRNRPGKINHWYRHPYEKCLNSTYGYRHLNSITSFLSRTLGSRAAPMIASRNSKTTVADCRWPPPSSNAASSLSVAMRSRSDTSHRACHAILDHTRRIAYKPWRPAGRTLEVAEDQRQELIAIAAAA